MGEGIVIDLAPIVADESADQEEEGALRHVEIGDDALYKMIMVAWGYDECGAGVEGVGAVEVQPGAKGAKTFRVES